MNIQLVVHLALDPVGCKVTDHGGIGRIPPKLFDRSVKVLHRWLPACLSWAGALLAVSSQMNAKDRAAMVNCALVERGMPVLMVAGAAKGHVRTKANEVNVC